MFNNSFCIPTWKHWPITSRFNPFPYLPPSAVDGKNKSTVEPWLSGPRLSRFLDYPDFFSGLNLVMIIYKSWSRFVAISFLKLQHWKVQSNARVFCSQRAKAALTLVVSNEEHSMMSSDWLRVAMLLSEISRFMACEKMKLASRTFIHDVFQAQAIRSFHRR